MTSLPQLSCRVAFGSNPYDPSLTWTEIGPASGAGPGGHGWVRKVQTKRGRERLLRTQVGFQAGTATVTLDNRDRRFDPTNTSGPYWPDVQPEKCIQVGATWQGTFYPLWTGYVDDWPQSWPGIGEAEVAVAATDWFKAAGIARVLSSGYPQQVLADGAIGYWRLGDITGPAAADSGPNNYAGVYIGAVALGGTGALPGDLSTSCDFADGTSAPTGWVQLPPLAAAGASTFSIEAWVYSKSWSTSDGSDSSVFESSFQGAVATAGVGLAVTPTGQVTLDVTDVTGNNFAIKTTVTTMSTGVWHHVVATYSGGTIAIYIDGAAQPLTSQSYGSAPEPFTPQAVGIAGSQAPGWAGSLQEVALYPSVLTAAQVADHYELSALGASPYGPVTSDRYISQLLSGWFKIPSRMLSIDTGYTLCQPDTQKEVNTKLLDMLQKIEQTEQGQLFVSASGVITFQNRYHRYTYPNLNSVATIGDGGSSHPSEIPYAMGGLTLNFDRAELYNDLTVTRRGGNAQEATNPASITAYGNRAPAGLADLMMADDIDALYCAEWILADTAYPQFRVGTLVIDPRTDPRWWPVVLGTEIGQVVTINKHTIPGGGPALSLACRLEGVEHQISPPNQWLVTWHVSLVGTSPWLIWNDPVTGFFDIGARWGW